MSRKLSFKTTRIVSIFISLITSSSPPRINKSSIIEVVCTDTIPVKTELSSKIKVLSIGDLFGDVINKVYNFQSISGSFIV